MWTFSSFKRYKKLEMQVPNWGMTYEGQTHIPHPYLHHIRCKDVHLGEWKRLKSQHNTNLQQNLTEPLKMRKKHSLMSIISTIDIPPTSPPCPLRKIHWWKVIQKSILHYQPQLRGGNQCIGTIPPPSVYYHHKWKL